MGKHRFEIILAGLFFGVFFAFSSWYSPGTKLSKAQVDTYISSFDKNLPWPVEEKALILQHLRAWGEADDGQPVYMLNLMRYLPELRASPEIAGFKGTPAEANAFYEEHVMPILFRLGAYPVFASSMQGVISGAQPSTNLITFDPAVDNWSTVAVVRYPDRTAFFELLNDPEYIKYLPYKAASVMVGLTPMKGDLVLPLLDWAVGIALLILFLSLAWWRALRRSR